MRIILSLTQILVILFVQNVSAQWHKNGTTGSVSLWEIGLSGGVSSFVTSVNPSSATMSGQINYWSRDENPGIGLSVVRNISPAFGIELNYLNTRLTGTWNNKYPPLAISVGHESPLTFDSRINQFDLMAAFNLNQMLLPGDEEDLWHIYLKTGVGLTHINDNKNFYPGDNPYNKMSLVIDAGLSVSMSDKIKLMLGSSFRSINTDNLDGVHVESTDLNGKTISYMKVYEIYNYTYLKVSYCLGDFGSKKTKNTFKNKKGKYRIFRKR
jgi:hypothetical protein